MADRSVVAEKRQIIGKQVRTLRETQIRLFRKLGLDHVVVRTDQPYIRPLRELFQRRARRLFR